MELTDHNDGYSFLIGDDPTTGRPRYYRGEQSLATIAQTGSGKSQCHMIPNLLTWRGAAVILDVKGELWAATSKQRSTYGPVYRIDPDHYDQSDHYNPFDFIRRDLDHIWGDSCGLAELVYSQLGAGSDGKFFDGAAINYIAAFACYIAYKLPPHLQTMETLTRFVSGAELPGFLTEAAKIGELSGLQNAVANIRRSDERTLANVGYTARECLSPWENPGTAAISRLSDWHPAMVRDHNATVYLCLSLEQMRSHPAFIRLLVGQHLRAFMRGEPDRAAPRVQFFLDEMPQLRHMPVLLQALDAGRGYNVALWMVAQDQGQIITAYGKETAQGMLAACGLRAFMNPSLADGSAVAVAEAIGKSARLFRDDQRPIVTPQDLTGPDYRGDVVTFVGGQAPARLRKHPFHADAALRAMAGASP